MKNETPTERTCPKCGCVYTEVPALSRVDNETLICPDCGIREALDHRAHGGYVGVHVDVF